MQTGQVLEAQVAALDPLLPACGRHQIWLSRVLYQRLAEVMCGRQRVP